MTGSYKEGTLDAKRKRDGIEDQRERVFGKKKKVSKPWVVAWEYGLSSIYGTVKYRFAKESDAIKQMEKIERSGYSTRKNLRLYNSEVDKVE